MCFRGEDPSMARPPAGPSAECSVPELLTPLQDSPGAGSFPSAASQRTAALGGMDSCFMDK